MDRSCLMEQGYRWVMVRGTSRVEVEVRVAVKQKLDDVEVGTLVWTKEI